MNLIRNIRAMIEDGMTDAEISDVIAECAEAQSDHEAMYGRDYEDFDGPSHLLDDGYYSRNDAGEWAGM